MTVLGLREVKLGGRVTDCLALSREILPFKKLSLRKIIIMPDLVSYQLCKYLKEIGHIWQLADLSDLIATSCQSLT